MNAATSEARKYSPSPTPTTSGELRRAPTTVSGSSAATARSVNAPSRRAQTRVMASVRFTVDGVLEAQELGGDLGVGVGRELDPGGLELGAQLREILDDAVVDEGDVPVGGEVRVRVAVGGDAVGRPAGVPDAARGGRERVVGQGRFEVRELPGPLVDSTPSSGSTSAMPAES